MSNKAYPVVHCRECGNDQEAHYSNRDEMVAESLCFTCLFWVRYVRTADDPTHVRVEGSHYVIGNENQDGPRRWRGCGGGLFVVKFFDGRPEVRSTNMWVQGAIPERFKERLPDNAEFLKQD